MDKILFKNLTVDQDKKECYIDNSEIILTKTEYNLLVFFLKNKDKIYTRKEIMMNVWNSNVSLRAIDTTISRLRKKLGTTGKHIVTRLGFGYGFIADKSK